MNLIERQILTNISKDTHFSISTFKIWSEVYDHPQKPTKRPSLFFRKRKDKSKTKGQPTNCDGKCHSNRMCIQVGCFIQIIAFLSGLGCGIVINSSTNKDHASECKAKLSKVCAWKMFLFDLFIPHGNECLDVWWKAKWKRNFVCLKKQNSRRLKQTSHIRTKRLKIRNKWINIGINLDGSIEFDCKGKNYVKNIFFILWINNEFDDLW